jgi:hypothetical protein
VLVRDHKILKILGRTHTHTLLLHRERGSIKRKQQQQRQETWELYSNFSLFLLCFYLNKIFHYAAYVSGYVHAYAFKRKPRERESIYF